MSDECVEVWFYFVYLFLGVVFVNCVCVDFGDNDDGFGDHIGFGLGFVHVV